LQDYEMYSFLMDMILGAFVLEFLIIFSDFAFSQFCQFSFL
jgi:hypothetical protein